MSKRDLIANSPRGGPIRLEDGFRADDVDRERQKLGRESSLTDGLRRRLMTFPTRFLASPVDRCESSSPEVIARRSTLPTEFILFPAPDRNSSRKFLRSPAVAALSAIPVATGCRVPSLKEFIR
jgi:hypothetical protein